MKLSVVYIHTSPSGKAYIGQTINYKKRCMEHQNPTGCRVFFRAVEKYGWASFTHEILHSNLSPEEANRLERLEIQTRRTMHPHGYNLRSGGDESRPSEETKELMRAARARQILPPVSNETRLKMSIAQTGRMHSVESRAKMSAVQKLIPKKPEAIAKMAATKRGQKQSEESNLKRSISQKGRVFTSEHRLKLSMAAKIREDERRLMRTATITPLRM